MPTDVKDMFDSIAENYDKLNDILSLGRHLKIKKKAISNVDLKPNFKILDICCGTGDITVYIAKNVIEDGKVVGLDFSQNMLEIAKKKSVGLNNIEFVFADALNLPFEDGEFDACFISFGLRNLSNLKKGLLEMKRVTKKGGFVVNLDTGKPKGVFNLVHKFYFFRVVPFVGNLLTGNKFAYEYLPESTKNFPSASELVKIFKEIGLNDVKKNDFLFGAISQQIGTV